ncbi:MAG: kinase [Parcubacteria group bacterium CG11_big_fil_rev_8_21_14_0_20_39_14]|nr:MAG: kinase [Parcubacteria group bacterium CG11_big_fil_rev_8_21_14_0_20_39_14]PIS35418.1 MAG: kinase [Parcubacteria group bacterium CG08_land_8_20_14_0_20_38_56]
MASSKPKLIIVCGLPGTGKTTTARRLAVKINGVLLRTDEIRRRFSKKRRYTSKEKQRVYNVMFFRAKRLLQAGKNVVLDGTFAKKKNRELARKIAKELGVNFQIIEVICDENIVKQRISKRFADESEAKFKHYLEHKKIFEPISEKHIIINTTYPSKL